MMLRLLPIALALAVSACTGSSNDSATHASIDNPQQGGYPDAMDGERRNIDPALMAPAAARPMRGAYVFGHEAESFQECGNSAEWWAEGDEALMQPLRQLAMQQAESTGQPYHPIYIQATGELLGKDEEGGFATNFDNVVKLTNVTSSQAQLPEDCELPAD